MPCTSIPWRENHRAALISAGLVVAAMAWLAGRWWEWKGGELATVLGLLALLGALLALAWRGHQAALERGVAEGAGEALSGIGAHRDALLHIGRCTRELDEHCDVSRKELHRLRVLLDEAIDNLIASFSALQELAVRQRLIALPDMGARSEAMAHRRLLLAEIDAQFDRHVDDVVTTLQFQDIATQLVDHARAGVEQAHLLSGRLRALCATAEASTTRSVSETDAASSASAQDVDNPARAIGANSIPVARIAPGEVELF